MTFGKDGTGIHRCMRGFRVLATLLGKSSRKVLQND
jgi:hypothetical protein